jgi:hypothetical protein
MKPAPLVCAASLVGTAVALPAPPSSPLFVDVAAASGLRFAHTAGASGEYYMPEIMGAGGALLDFDGDGDLDVFLVQGVPLGPGGAAGSGHRLFRNDLGPGGPRFVDVTEGSGVGQKTAGMGAAVGDYDNDGDPDLYVTAFGPNALFRNEGGGRFRDVTAEAGVGEDRWSTSASFLDYDRDGDLDLFVANYLDFTVAGNKRCLDAVGARDYCTPSLYRPVPDRLFRNEGGGRFQDVGDAAGITRADGPGLGVVAGDFDDDGWLDLYVANDGAANQLWMNRRDGTFEDRGLLSGTAYNAEGLPEGSMGVAADDFDGDGDEDLLVTNLPRETSTLYVNQGQALFHDATDAWGLGAPSATHTGFGTAFFDYDHDGWLDLFVANGAVTVVEALRGRPYPFQETSQLFHHPGTAPFEEASARLGLTRAEVSRGVAAGDVDNDGDLDLLLTNNNGPARLLLNAAPRRGGFLQVRLRGTVDNRDGLGARVGVVRAGAPTLWRRARTDGSYLTAGDPRVHVGLGAARPREIVVRWPTGRQEAWPAGEAERLITLIQGTGRAVAPAVAVCCNPKRP